MAVFYLIYEPHYKETDLQINCGGEWISVLEDSSLCRIKSEPFKAWLYQDEDTGWPGFFFELLRVSGHESAEIYFSGSKDDLEALREEAKLFTDKKGREIIVYSVEDEYLKALEKLCRALRFWQRKGRKGLDEAAGKLKESFMADLKSVNRNYNLAYGADDFLYGLHERIKVLDERFEQMINIRHKEDECIGCLEEKLMCLEIRDKYLDDIVKLYYDSCDKAKKELTLVYSDEYDAILTEFYKKDVLIPDNRVLSWKVTTPYKELQTPEFIKEYLEITTRWRLSEITGQIEGMYETKLMQYKDQLRSQCDDLAGLLYKSRWQANKQPPAAARSDTPERM